MLNLKDIRTPAIDFPSRTNLRFQRLWRAIEGNSRATCLALIVFYLVLVCSQAATKLLWCDELFTLAIARQESFAGIWHGLAMGADPNPPLMHWLVMLSTDAFGNGSLAVRLPAILCVLLAIVSLWSILRRWVSPGFAAVGVLAFMATRGFDYAYDARSYAGLLGFAMASLALWLASNDRAGWRGVAVLAGMAAALALGLSFNYYGVLAFFPIAAGEAVRTVQTRRLRAGAWIAMAIAALPLLAYLPLIRHNIAEFTPHAWNHPRKGMIVDSYIELVEGVFWPVLGLAVFALWKHKARFRGLRDGGAVAVAVLLVYPFLGLILAEGGAGMISPRCVVPVCCGFGIAAALLGRRLFGDSPRAGLTLLGIALVWVVARESACAVVLAQQRDAFFQLRDEVAAQPATQPILVGDSLFVLPLAHYSSASVRSRIVFPIDFDAIHRYEKDDSGEQNLWAGRDGIFPVKIMPYNDLGPACPYLLIARPDGWLTRRLSLSGFLFHPVNAVHPAWQRLGGVFTPLAHDGDALSLALPSGAQAED